MKPKAGGKKSMGGPKRASYGIVTRNAKRRRALKAMSATIVLSDSENDEHRNHNEADEAADNNTVAAYSDDEIQVIDIADVSQEEDAEPEVVNLNEDKSDSATDHTKALKTESSPTTETEPPVINICDEADPQVDDDDDGIEIVAVVVSAPRQGGQQAVVDGTSNKKKRKSNTNLSIMQEAVKKAKKTMRRSSLGSRCVSPAFRLQNVLSGISGNSRMISRKQSKKKKKKFHQQADQRRFQGKNARFNRTREDNRQVIYRTQYSTGPQFRPVVMQGVPQVENPFRRMNPRNYMFTGMSNPFRSLASHGESSTDERMQWISRNRTGTGPGPPHVAPGSNIMNVASSVPRPVGALRPIVIDGSNIAIGHGKMLKTGKFSARGIKICIDYFLKRGHKEIVVFVPRFRLKKAESMDPELLEELERDGYVKFTPSREAGAHRISSYDDLFVVQYANETGGIIVSNDNFRDLYEKNEPWRETIEFRILQHTWITQDCIMFPQDPLGRHGPSLDDFLRF